MVADMAEITSQMKAQEPRKTGWLIRKAGRGWYMPKAQGYTSHPSIAGRFSYDDALSYSHPNGWTGPRDGITIKHEDDIHPPTAAGPLPLTTKGMARENAALTAKLEAAEELLKAEKEKSYRILALSMDTRLSDFARARIREILGGANG